MTEFRPISAGPIRPIFAYHQHTPIDDGNTTNTDFPLQTTDFCPILPSDDTPTTSHVHPFPRDQLDAHINRAATRFQRAMSWSDFVRMSRGRGDLCPGINALPHPAAHLLGRYQKLGTAVVMTSDSAPRWTGASIVFRPGADHSSSCLMLSVH